MQTIEVEMNLLDYAKQWKQITYPRVDQFRWRLVEIYRLGEEGEEEDKQVSKVLPS